MEKQSIEVDKNNYYELLRKAQNNKDNMNQDIISITGLMNWAQKLDHLQYYMPKLLIIDNSTSKEG